MKNSPSPTRTPLSPSRPASRQATRAGKAQAQPFPSQIVARIVVAWAVCLGLILPLAAQPVLVSTVPSFMATGVSPTAPMVFTFSEAMSPAATTAQFMDATSFPPAFLTATPAWSSGNTVLTCTPVPSWPPGQMIVWFVEGENAQGDPLDGEAGGVFTIADSGTIICTNEVGSMTVGKGALYRQTSAGAPVLETLAPCVFVACATIACTNFSTTNITTAIPGRSSVNLQPTGSPGSFSFTDLPASLSLMDSRYPAGDYLFTLRSPENTWLCTVEFPATLVMPNAPHLADYPQTQAIDPTRPFVLGWGAFEGGTAADGIHVEIYGDVFQTPGLGLPGALPGTARSVVIPAGTLEPGESYEGAITFYDLVLSTNSCGYISLAYYSAITEFRLITAGDEVPSLAINSTTTNTFLLSWPATGSWILERTNVLPPQTVPWPAVPPPYPNDGERFSVAFTNTPAGDQFFRLRKP
jgi:hypothetical protein